METDPFAVLGIERSATLAEAEAAYRRLASRWHPDHLTGRPAGERAHGETQLRSINAAITAIRAAGTTEDHGDSVTRAEAHEFNAQVREVQPGGLHASWPGPHAAAVWTHLRRAHAVHGPVQQVEWGSYECALHGSDLRRLLRTVGPASWDQEPLDLLEVDGPARRRVTSADLAELDRRLDDSRSYVLTAEVI